MTGNTKFRRLALGFAALAPGLALAAAPGLVTAKAWASDDPPAAVAEVEVEEANETFPSHGKRITVERFAPKPPGRYPLVIVLHGHGGIGPPGTGSPLREEARWLARQGYVALIPHYFDRTGTNFKNAVRNARYYRIWMETISDTVTYAGRLPQVDRRRVGLIGHSLGASVVVSCGMLDRRITAVVEYAGSLVGEPPPQLPTMPPTPILHGDADRIVPVREALKLEALFNQWQTPFEIKIYPGAGHGLTGADAEDARRRTLAFLARYLKRE